MDDLERKLFAQLDDDFPGVRSNAFEMLREHLRKEGRSFRAIVQEVEGAGNTAKEAAELRAALHDIEQKYRELDDDLGESDAQLDQALAAVKMAEQRAENLSRRRTAFQVPFWRSGIRLFPTAIAIVMGIALLVSLNNNHSDVPAHVANLSGTASGQARAGVGAAASPSEVTTHVARPSAEIDLAERNVRPDAYLCSRFRCSDHYDGVYVMYGSYRNDNFPEQRPCSFPLPKLINNQIGCLVAIRHAGQSALRLKRLNRHGDPVEKYGDELEANGSITDYLGSAQRHPGFSYIRDPTSRQLLIVPTILLYPIQ